MEGGEHHVSGESCLDCDDRRFLVSNLSDQDNVRVGAEDGAESGSEVQAGLQIELHLVDTLEWKFDRVFNGDDVFSGELSAVKVV